MGDKVIKVTLDKMRHESRLGWVNYLGWKKVLVDRKDYGRLDGNLIEHH